MSTNVKDGVDEVRLGAITNEKINDPETLTRLINECREMGCHVLSPVQKIDSIAPGHVVSLAMVWIRPVRGEAWHDRLWDGNEGEPEYELAPTHSSLNRLWIAAGGRWNLSEDNTDPNAEPFVVTWQAGGAIKEPAAGQWIPEIASRTEDYRDGSPQVHGWSDGQKRASRSRQYERTESFAKNRVIRKLLGVDSTYTLAALSYPFIVVRTSYVADPSDPLARTMLLADSMGSSAALFNSPAFTGFLKELAQVSSREALDAAQESKQISDGAHSEPPDSTPDPLEESLLDFNNSDKDGQIHAINDLIDERVFDTGKLKGKKVDRLNKANRLELFTHLLGLPKKGGGEADLQLDL